MGQSSYNGSGLTQLQAKTFKLSVSAACRKMTADQILDLADHLHMIIRRRGAGCGSAEVAAYDPCAGDAALFGELMQ